jgi:alpha-galactosidase
MPTPIVVVVGAGSAVFGLPFLQDFFQVPDLRGARLRLVDVTPAALARMRRLAEVLSAESGWDVTVEATGELEAALPGASFVVTSVAVDRMATWMADHEMALRHGFPSVLSENGGPGGLSHTLRSVPLVLEIAEAVERLAPDALILNYTNPENRICLAIARHTGVRAIGLCHGVAGTTEWVAGVLDLPFERVDLDVAGVNHFNWVLAMTDRETGADLEPAFARAVAALPEDQWRLCRYAWQRLGTFPTTGDDHVGEYLPWAAGLIGTAGYDFAEFEASARRLTEQVERWGRGEEPVRGLLAELSSEGRVNHSAATLIGDMVAGRDADRPSFILPNDGLVPDLRPDAVVEVAGRLEAGVPRGRIVGGLPVPVRGLVERELEIQELAVAAAVEGSRTLALQALLLDPVVQDARAAEAFLDEVLTRHRAYLPRFA